MKYNQSELNSLSGILEKYRESVIEKRLIKIVSTYNKFLSSFNKFYTTLCSEKIINIDPYGEDYNLEKLDKPDSSPVPYNEEAYTISIRMGHYNSLLNYIKGEELLTLENLDPEKIEKIEKLIHFMDWNRIFDPQPIEINTEALNKILFYYRKDRGQKFILASLQASTTDISNYAQEISTELIPIKLYYNEKYKLWIREVILPLIKLPPELMGQNIKKAHDIVSSKITESSQPLFIELIGEVLSEDFTQKGEQVKKTIQEKIIKGGDEPERTKKEKKKEDSPKELLVKSLLELSKTTSQTDSIIEKQQENTKMIREETFSILEKIIDYLKYNLLGCKRSTLYKIKIKEKSNKVETEKNIEVEKFLDSIYRLDKTFTEFKTNDNLLKIIDENEKEIDIELRKLLSKSRYNYKILSALDNYFKSKLKMPKGIQMELKVLKSSTESAQSIYFNYQKREENTQKETTYRPGINLTT